MLFLFLPACSTPPAVEAPLPPSAAASTATADWDDVDAAVLVGVASIESVVARTVALGPRHRQYHLRLFTGEPGLLDATIPAGADPDRPAPIHLAATIGRLGDPERERTLLRAVERRVEQLRGVEVAPIP